MTYKQVVKQYSSLLREITHIPQTEVEILLLFILDKNNIWLHMNYNEECKCEKELEKLVKKKSYRLSLRIYYKKSYFLWGTILCG